MVSFLIAFGFMCLQDTGIDTRSVIVILGGIFLILTFWCIWTSWRNPEPSNADEPKRTAILTFEEDHVKREKGFKFTREGSDTTKLEPEPEPELPTRRSRTLSIMATTFFKAPIEKLRRDSSKKVVEESIEMR
jgi:hypothetical protein